MEAEDRQFKQACAGLHIEFFQKFPNDELRGLVSQALTLLLERQTDFPGDAAGWAGGIVYAVGSGGCGVPNVLNADLEKALGTTMATIRKRAAHIKRLLGDDAPLLIPGIPAPAEFTLRDEANAICAYAFRNGPFERLHHEYKISQDDVKELMINASEHLAKIMAMKRDTPAEYEAFIRNYHREFCLSWER